jgi:hypothetical protein
MDQLSDDPLTSRIKANLIFGWVDQSISNLIEKNPTFSATPLQKEVRQFAPVVSQISNYWYRETDQLRQDERILLDAFLMPYGVKKLGWTSDQDRVEAEFLDKPEFDFEDDVDSENMFLLTGVPAAVTPHQDHPFHIEAHTLILQQPNITPDAEQTLMAHMDLHQTMMDRAEPDAHTSIRWQSPFGVRWPPDMFVVDPNAQDGLRDAKWIAFKIVKPVDDVKTNPNYRNVDDLEASPGARPPGAPEEDPEMGMDDFAFVSLWEIWARDMPTGPRGSHRNSLHVIAEGYDSFLRDEEEWPYRNIEDFPAELLIFQQSPARWYTKPSLSLAGGDNIQAIANEVLDSFLYVSRKLKNIVLYDPALFPEEGEIDNILRAPDMSAFPVKGLSRAGGNAIFPVNLGSVSQDKNFLLQQVIGLFDRAAGTPQPIRNDADTATEASIFERRTTAREARRGSLLSQFQVRVARKMWQLTTQFKPDNLPLIHPLAEEAVQVTEEMAKGEYRFRMDVRSHSQSVALERKQWTDLLNLAAGLAGIFQQTYGEPPNLVKLFERVLRNGYEDPAPEEILPMLEQLGADTSLPPEVQAQIQAQLEGTPGQAQTGGPSLTGPPVEVEAENAVGPALPRQFNRPAPNAAQISATGETA